MTDLVAYMDLIINSPYKEPERHWHYVGGVKTTKEGRRNSEYIIDSAVGSLDFEKSNLKEIALVNRIRESVKQWKEAGEPGISSTTENLLLHWRQRKNWEEKAFFFCQLEAIETIIFLNDAPKEYKAGLNIPKDQDIYRLCTKMATGTGKTIVMGMLIAYHALNKINHPNSTKHTKHILVIAPNLTVKERLQVLYPDRKDSVYEEMNIIPPDYKEKFTQTKIICHNWHTLAFNTQEEIDEKLAQDKVPAALKTIDKRKKTMKSDEAYLKGILQDVYTSTPILIINDEAHHAWRDDNTKRGEKMEAEEKREFKKEKEAATKWIKAIERISKKPGIIACHDFSATPFKPGGKHNAEQDLFKWIISDFALVEAIESGLVKTPKVPAHTARENQKYGYNELRKLYQVEGVKQNLKINANPTDQLPEQVLAAYDLMVPHRNSIEEKEANIGNPPPVIITVANNTRTAERIESMFVKGIAGQTFKGINDKDTEMKRIDSKVLEADDKKGEELREIIATIGKRDKPGENFKNIISVNMLNEGWDAKNVTHIVGLRAFTSDLLCEQIVGRGLRRQSYDINKDGLLQPEYVYIVGIPFSFIQSEEKESTKDTEHKPVVEIYPDENKQEHEIQIPNILQTAEKFIADISIDRRKIKPLILKKEHEIQRIDMAPIINGETYLDRDLKTNIYAPNTKYEYRKQTQIFAIAAVLYDKIITNKKAFAENEKQIPVSEDILCKIIDLAKWAVNEEKILINGKPIGSRECTISADGKICEFQGDDDEFEIVTIKNQTEIADWLFKEIQASENENSKREVKISKERPIISTGDMKSWYTKRETTEARKSHINRAVTDSGWEEEVVRELEKNKNVVKWVKNDHLDFHIPYINSGGKIDRYIPDFLIHIRSEAGVDIMLVLEVKGQKDIDTYNKEKAMEEWIKAANTLNTEYNLWVTDMNDANNDIKQIIDKYSGMK